MASLTVLGVCDNSNRARMDNVVESEARKIGFLNPRCAVAEINQEKGSWWLALNRFCIADMWKHFETDFVLVVQFDGRIFNPGAWNDGFFKYDWIGAPWPDGVCGNGGCCRGGCQKQKTDRGGTDRREACHRELRGAFSGSETLSSRRKGQRVLHAVGKGPGAGTGTG